MSGPEMLLKAAISAFVPKETVEEISVTIQGMLKDGTLHGLGSLVADIREIKEQQGRLMLALGRLFALHSEQQLHAGREENGLSGGTGNGPLNVVAAIAGPGSVREPGDSGGADSELDGVRGGDVPMEERIGTAAHAAKYPEQYSECGLAGGILS